MTFHRLFRGPLTSLALLLVAGCAASSSSPPAMTAADSEDPVFRAAVAELELRKAELARLQGVSSCEEVCRLTDLICVAGAHVCDVAGRHAGERDYAVRCHSATEDCHSARQQCSECR